MRRALLLSLFALAACDGDKVHAFRARRFEPAKGCLDPQTVLDVIAGDGGACAPVQCLVTREDGAPAAYVTADCPPYPPGVDPSGNDPTCPRAKAAWDRNDTCTDAGSTHPLDAASD